MQDILERLADLGIKIRIDPQINPKITASFQDRDLRQGLDSILKPFGHALIWDAVKGPFGTLPKLTEIQVFNPGRKDLMEPLGSRPGFAVAKDPKGGSLFVKDEILLGLGPDMSLSEFKRLLRELGGTILDSHPGVGIYRIRLPEDSDVPALLREISRHPKVAKAEPNYAYPLPAPLKQGAVSWSGPEPSSPATPAGIIPIAVLDTGMDPHSGAQEYVLASLDALDPEEPLTDSLGHGTQMALIAAGVVRPSGMSKDEGTRNPIIPIRVMDDRGFTSNFTLMRSIDFAVKQGARVMSLSWGSETKSDFLESALNYARSKGIIVVASAGNKATGRPVYPAAFPSVIGVGALGPDGKSWEKSNYGDFVMLYAPGFASLPVGYKGGPGTYAGTSIAAAYTANVIASYLSEHPDATLPEVIRAIGRE